MPIELNIVTEQELKAYAKGRLKGPDRQIVVDLLQQDDRAQRYVRDLEVQANGYRKEANMNFFASNSNEQTHAEQPNDALKHLKVCLADTYMLMAKTQAVHWNVTGVQFIGLHELTEVHYRNLFEAVDELAERIRSLGYPAPTGISELIDPASIKDEKDMSDTQIVIERLARNHLLLAKKCLETAEIANGEFDIVTADMLTQRIAFHEKAAWMLKSQLN